MDTPGTKERASGSFEFDDLFESSPVAILLLTGGLIRRANGPAAHLLGREVEELVGAPLSAFLAPESPLDLAGISQNGQGLSNRLVLQHARGGAVTVNLHVRPSTGAGGEAEYLCYLVEVPDENVHQLQSRLGAIVQNSDDAIISKDLNGTILSWNAGAERLFGYTEAEALGKSIRMLIPPELQEEEDRVLTEIRAGRRIDHYETLRQRKDGSQVHISLTISPVRDAEGRIIGASKIARDITVRKEAENVLLESMQARENFLSLVSHELRTPITIIYGLSKVLRERSDALTANEIREIYHDIELNSERLQEIIEHLLLLTRMDADDSLETEFVRLERVVDALVQIWERRSPARVFVVEAEPQLPLVACDRALTRLVIDNFISNAIKYSPAGQPIEVRMYAGSDSAVVLDVLDRGIGIAKENVEHLFRPFYRSTEARNRAGGMGLGLAVCKRIAEAQGGSVTAEPRDGGGSIFRLTIPAVPIDET